MEGPLPTDLNGNYSLPGGYLAIAGETVQPSQHNPPLEDLAAAVSGRLPINGAKAMTAPLKAADGSASAPSVTFGSATGTGFYKSSNGIGVAIAGQRVAEFGPSGVGGIVGSGMDFWGSTAPPGWVFAYGQALSRTTYADLFAVLGTTYGAGDGFTTFNLPDKRGRVSAGKDDMGGSSANRLTNQSGGLNGDTLGAAGGAETHTLTLAQIKAHDHGGATGSTKPQVKLTGLADADSIQATNNTTLNGGATAIQLNGQAGASEVEVLTHTHTIPSAGGDEAHNNVQPTIVCNYIICTGVV